MPDPTQPVPPSNNDLAPKGGSKMPGWVAALGIVVALALVGWRIGVPKYEEWKANNAEAQKEATAAAYVNKQRMKPRKIGGMMTMTLDEATAPAPTGITISVDDGKYAYRADGPYDGVPPYESTVADRFRKSLDALVDAASKDEHLKGAKTLSVSFVSISGKSSEPIKMQPDPGQSQDAFLKERNDWIAKEVQSWVDILNTEMNDLLKSPIGSIPPPGFAVSFSDDHYGSVGLNPIRVLPLKESDVKERLVAFITMSLEKTRPAANIPHRRNGPMPMQPGASMSMGSGSKPNVKPSVNESAPANMVHVTIEGPGGEVDFDVPIGPTKEYPTDADVKRGRDAIVDDKAGEAAKQINDLNEKSAKG